MIDLAQYTPGPASGAQIRARQEYCSPLRRFELPTLRSLALPQPPRQNIILGTQPGKKC